MLLKFARIVRTTAQPAIDSQWAIQWTFQSKLSQPRASLFTQRCIFGLPTSPDFAIDLQIEEDEGEEGDDARDDYIVPPSGEFHVLLVLEDLRHFVVDGAAIVPAADQVVLEEAGKVLCTDFSFHSA